MSYWIKSKPVDGSDYGGDFALSIDLASQRRAVIVGDIAGHHTAAGDARALGAYVRYFVAAGFPLDVVLRAASRFFMHNILTDAIAFASLFIAVADLYAGTIDYASAGHEPALLFNGDGTGHDHLPPTGPLLGLEPASAFGRRTVPLVPNGLLVVVTDGITEAHPDLGNELVMFGSAGVARAVRDAVRARRDPAQEIYAAAVQHAGGALVDDACVVVSELGRLVAPAFAQRIPVCA